MTVRTLGQMAKAKLYRQNHTRGIYILTKREKEKKCIYIYIIKKGREQPNQ